MRLSEFRTDRELEKEGVWHALSDETSIKVARMGNANFQKAWRRIVGPYETQISTGKLDNAKAEDLYARVYADAILVDWKGFTDDNDKPIPYTKEAAAEAIRTMRDFRELVRELADKAELFRVAKLEEDAENLKSGAALVD